jgi:hypothetical protein
LLQEFEAIAAELEIDFEDYYQREQQLQQQLPDMTLLRAIKHFLTKERISPFSLDVPSDFAYGQWGI